MDDKIARINKQIKRLNPGPFILGRKEIGELPQILWDDEEIQDIVQGMYNNGNGILMATERRLVFIDKGMFYGLKVEDFPVEKISSIQYESGLLFGTITIFTSGNKAIIKQVDKTKARTFSEGVRARTAKGSATAPSAAKATFLPVETPAPTAASPAPSGNLIAEIEQLATLRERGLLTDEEFAAAKRKLLDL